MNEADEYFLRDLINHQGRKIAFKSPDGDIWPIRYIGKGDDEPSLCAFLSNPSRQRGSYISLYNVELKDFVEYHQLA